MNQSITTEYQQDSQFSQNLHSQLRSIDNDGQDVYISKLQAKVKQLKTNIRKNKPLLQQMKVQRKFMKKVCEKQRQKIEGAKLELIRSQYENEIEQMRREKHQLEDMMELIHEESSVKAQQFVEAKEQIQRNGAELNKALEEVKRENQILEQMLIVKNQAIDLKNCETAFLNDEIEGKENIEKKYKQVINQIQKLQSKCHR